MTLRLSDLSPMQVRLMARLDDGHPHDDSVGIEIADLPAEFMPAAGALAALKLIEERHGWDGTVWLRLTMTGRMLREDG